MRLLRTSTLILGAALAAACFQAMPAHADDDQLGPKPAMCGIGCWGAAGTTLDDALLICPALERLCAAAGDPLASDAPPPEVVPAIRALAAIGLTVGANASGPACHAELAFERTWRLTQATAFAAQDSWCLDEPDGADWPDWLMFLLSCAATVVESCAACLHPSPPDIKSLHAEHHATPDEQLDHAAGLLVIVALQALALFGGGEPG